MNGNTTLDRAQSESSWWALLVLEDRDTAMLVL